MNPANIKEKDTVKTQSRAEISSKAQVQNPLDMLEVISRMEVGPVRLEKNRFTAPYKIWQNKKNASFNLIYHYEESVFNSKDFSSLNLASMIASQVAINYGLFCKEIIFHGPFDRIDQKFIKDMMINTAREIYVKKFLEPNPFLIGRAASLPLEKKDNYLRSKISFSAAPANTLTMDRKAGQEKGWITDRSRHAVLSSGGKDSLLSFGLLREMGREVHPVFINESGRHWFTALNGYRHLAANFPETTKVWTNADRLFAWMLRHFPFVRQDFAKIRSDEYPIRLWTVAVFLFAALPLLRKRGVGRLIIGDEYDTTVRLSHHGITHYDGLFDQSRYFDNTLTRYYIRKGWCLHQFSLLRPLSEMLIEKILVQRYHELQRHQVSCHASHLEKDRVHPCGKCEKCRRIVGMLTALEADPSNCGYSKEQVSDCLKMIPEKGVSQENNGAEHLSFLLKQKGFLPHFSKKLRIREHPEIMKVRIDPIKSPLETIPVDLRKLLFTIFLQHAKGAVKHQGRMWIDFDIVNDTDLLLPYSFEQPEEKPEPTRNNPEEDSSSKGTHLLERLTWPEAQARFKEVDIALLPVGSLEQHGPHLPLDTDSFDAFYLAKKVAVSCSPPRPLVLPLIPYGVSYQHSDFSGTLSITPKTLSDLVYEVGMSAVHNGITKLIIINGHGGNIPALQFAAQMINRDAHIFTCVETGETSEKDVSELTETPNDVHAGEVETSTSLAVRPDLVKSEKAQKFIPRFSSRYLNFSSKRSVEWYARIARISPTGIMGDPTKASREKGEKIWALMIKHLVEFVEDLKGMTLDEIFQKRF